MEVESTVRACRDQSGPPSLLPVSPTLLPGHPITTQDKQVVQCRPCLVAWTVLAGAPRRPAETDCVVRRGAVSRQCLALYVPRHPRSLPAALPSLSLMGDAMRRDVLPRVGRCTTLQYDIDNRRARAGPPSHLRARCQCGGIGTTLCFCIQLQDRDAFGDEDRGPLRNTVAAGKPPMAQPAAQ